MNCIMGKNHAVRAMLQKSEASSMLEVTTVRKSTFLNYTAVFLLFSAICLFGYLAGLELSK